jgi:hypothetical protein
VAVAQSIKFAFGLKATEFFLSSEILRRNIPPKRLLAFNELYGVISQNRRCENPKSCVSVLIPVNKTFPQLKFAAEDDTCHLQVCFWSHLPCDALTAGFNEGIGPEDVTCRRAEACRCRQGSLSAEDGVSLVETQ